MTGTDAIRERPRPATFVQQERKANLTPKATRLRVIHEEAGRIIAGNYKGVAKIVEFVAYSGYDPEIVTAARAALANLQSGDRETERDFLYKCNLYARNTAAYLWAPFLELLPKPIAFCLFEGRSSSTREKILLEFSAPEEAATFALQFIGNSQNPSLMTAAITNAVKLKGYEGRYSPNDFQSAYTSLSESRRDWTLPPTHPKPVTPPRNENALDLYPGKIADETLKLALAITNKYCPGFRTPSDDTGGRLRTPNS